MTKAGNLIFDTVNEFTSIGLKELEAKELIDRYDCKYVLNEQDLPSILEKLSEHYYILDLDGTRLFEYETVYFDTNDIDLYKDHHNGKNNRLKVRYRTYNDTGLRYFEIKKKSKYKTIKERLCCKDIEKKINGEAGNILSNKYHIDPSDLSIKLTVTYNRITLVNKKLEEKITLDTNLYFKNCVRERGLKGIVIAEQKTSRYSDTSEFSLLMKESGIHEIKISKYCTGTILTNPDIKYNRFKSKLLYINKILKGLDNGSN